MLTLRSLVGRHFGALILIVLFSSSSLADDVDTTPTLAGEWVSCGGILEPVCETGFPPTRYAAFWNYVRIGDVDPLDPTTWNNFTQMCDYGLMPQLVEDPEGGDSYYICFNEERYSNEAAGFGSNNLWLSYALSEQRVLSARQPLSWAQMIATHNSFNSQLGGEWNAPVLRWMANQRYSVSDQLLLGARTLLLDIHNLAEDGELPAIYSCHGKADGTGCTRLTSRPFYLQLKELRDWLLSRPSLIVIIILEANDPERGTCVDVPADGINPANSCDVSADAAKRQEVMWPIEEYLGDLVLRSDHVVDGGVTAYEYFVEARGRLPSRAEVQAMGKQVLFLTDVTNDRAFDPYEWKGTTGGGSGNKAKLLAFDNERYDCYATNDGGAKSSERTLRNLHGDTGAKAFHVYEGRSLLDSSFEVIQPGLEPIDNAIGNINTVLGIVGVDPIDFNLAEAVAGAAEAAGYLNRDLIASSGEPNLQRRLRDVINCGLTPALDYLYASDDTSDFIAEDGAQTLAPSARLAETVWSWRSGKFGPNLAGYAAVFAASDRRWYPAQTTAMHHFACSAGQPLAVDPAFWVDARGEGWYVTDQVGTWDQGEELCLEEVATLAQPLDTHDGPVLPLNFSIPVNGWQNQRLGDALQTAAARPGFDASSADVWLAYGYDAVNDLWLSPIPPAANLTPIDGPSLADEGENGLLFSVDYVNPYECPSPQTVPATPCIDNVKLTWTFYEGVGTGGTSVTLSEGPDKSVVWDFVSDGPHTVQVLLVGDVTDVSSQGLTTNVVLDSRLFVFDYANLPPEFTAFPAAVPQTSSFLTDVPAGIVFSGAGYTFTDPGGAADGPFTCSIDYGDGTAPSVYTTEDGLLACQYPSDTAGGSGKLLHVYATDGVYTVTVTVSDAEGEMVQDSFVVTTEAPAAPVINENSCSDTDLDPGELFVCPMEFTDLNAGDSWTATVDYGDGSPQLVTTDVLDSTAVSHYVIVSHGYADADTYDVTFTVEDDTGRSDSHVWTMTVANVIVPTELPYLTTTTSDGTVPTVAPGVDDVVDFDQATGTPEFPFTVPEVGPELDSLTRTFTVVDPDPTHTAWTVYVNYDGAQTQTNVAAEAFNVTSGDPTVELDFETANGFSYAGNPGTYTVKMTVVADEEPGSPPFITHIFTVTVLEVNTAPVVTLNAPAPTPEDAPMTFTGSFTDPDDDNWTGWIDFGDGSGPQPLDLLADKTFSVAYAYADDGSYPVTVTVLDGLATGENATTAEILPVNAQPTFTASDPEPVPENAGAVVIPGWASFDPGAPDEADQSPVWIVSGIDNPSLFAVLPSVNLAGDLSFTPAANTTGQSNFTVTVQDDGGTANGGVDTSEPQTFTISVFATETRFLVTKSFSDGTAGEVEVTLRCNAGLPLEQTATISPDNPVNFVLTDYEEGVPTCEVFESGPTAGYTPSYDNGNVVSVTACTWPDLEIGRYSCAITNNADPATFEVIKDWVIEGLPDTEVNQLADITIHCDRTITGGVELEGVWILQGQLGDAESLLATVDTSEGPATCYATEQTSAAGVEAVDDCAPRELAAGSASTCTFTNTVFFEGIPALDRNGLAVLILLLLGTGLVGVRWRA